MTFFKVGGMWYGMVLIDVIPIIQYNSCSREVKLVSWSVSFFFWYVIVWKRVLSAPGRLWVVRTFQ